MSLVNLRKTFGEGGDGIPDLLKPVLRELQGFSITVAAGATAGTKMDVAALRSADTLVSVLAFNAGVPADDTANCSIADTHATGTITCASVVEDDTVTIGATTFTFKATANVAAALHVDIGANDNETAANLVAALNAYQSRYVDSFHEYPAVVAASVNTNVVTLTAAVDGAAGNSIVLTSSNGTRLAVTGAGTLTGGSDTGGITSTTNLSTQTLVVVWFNKQ